MDKQTLKEHYDIIVIGGGIVGAGIVRDLALHKQDTLLIEKGDFSSQTSQGSSKMLHGGIRYLENFDFFLVHEALKEKKVWLNLTPHLAKERIFYLPVYKHSKWPLFFLRIGLFLYDLLSSFKNKPYRILSKKQTLIEMPGLNAEGLTGSGQYSDGVIDDSKLVLDLLLDAESKGVTIKNYHEIISTQKENNIQKVQIRNTITDEIIEVTCNKLIISVGPFTDQVMNNLNIPWQNIILPSKGSHLWLKKDSLPIKEAMVLQTKDGRIIFVIPQRNSILVGTTELPVGDNEEMFNIKPSPGEIIYLLNNLKTYFPTTDINENHVLASFAAVRPLVKSSFGASRGKTSRKHKLFKPDSNIHVIAGGKYTTFRIMAQDICKKVLKELNVPYQKNLSLTPLTVTTKISNIQEVTPTIEDIRSIIENEYPKSLEDLIIRRLSLFSLEQAKDPEAIKKLIEEIKAELPTI